MKKLKEYKLQLTRTTIRALSDITLDNVNGGYVLGSGKASCKKNSGCDPKASRCPNCREF